MKEHSYYKDTPIEEIEFPNADLRRVGHLVRNVRPIPGYRAVVDKNTDRTFAIVKDGYQLVRHEDAITQLDEIVREHPEWGEPVREIWMSNHGGRMKTRWMFPEVEFEIGKTSDGKPDTVNPTIETFCSLDTSLARALFLGGFRLICTNGMKVGKNVGRVQTQAYRKPRPPLRQKYYFSRYSRLQQSNRNVAQFQTAECVYERSKCV